MLKKDPLQIIAFQTYGTRHHLYLRGRAIEDENIDLEQKGIFKLISNAWKRFETDEIKNTEIVLKIGEDKFFYTKTDEKGYFLFDKSVDDLGKYVNEEGWLSYEVSYREEHLGRKIQSENRFPGEMLVPSKDRSFGVASDIDDTILHTGLVSTLKWRVIYNTLLKTASRRSPLKGAAEFYHQLHRGATGKETNPIFYVSHSPWNLYRYLEYFLKKNKFPKGAILLRDFPNPFGKKKNTDEKPQKQKEILNILKTYPELKLILIGDSGEHDPDIYMEIAELYPDRILAIYLRTVKHKERVLRVKGLYKDYKTTPVLLVEDSEKAIEHARSHGFIA